MAETIHVRGEGGAIFAMDLPLPEGIAERYERGLLVRVNADGSPYAGAPARAASSSTEQAPAGGSDLTDGRPPKPGATARKSEWTAWAVAVHGMDAASADALTLAALKELPDQPEPPVGTEPGGLVQGDRPDADAEKSEWIAFVVRKGLLSAEDAANYTKADLIEMGA